MTCCRSDSSDTPSANAGEKSSQGIIIIIIIVIINDTHKLLWDFDIQTDLLISARRSDIIIINKKKKKKRIRKIVDFAVPADHRIILKE